MFSTVLASQCSVLYAFKIGISDSTSSKKIHGFPEGLPISDGPSHFLAPVLSAITSNTELLIDGQELVIILQFLISESLSNLCTEPVLNMSLVIILFIKKEFQIS